MTTRTILHPSREPSETDSVTFLKKYQYNASTDIGSLTRDKYMKKVDIDVFDDYLTKIHKNKHKLMVESDLQEMQRVD